MAILIMLLGFIGVCLAFFVPHKCEFSPDLSFCAGAAGIFWMIICLIMASKLLFS